MICSNLHLRPLPRARTLLYLHSEKAQQEEDQLREHAGPPGGPRLGCKQRPGLQHMGFRRCVGKAAVGRSHSAGTPHPTVPCAQSLNRTLSLAPPHITDLLGTHSWPGVWCVLALSIRRRLEYAPHSTRMVLLQETKSL